MTSDIAIVVTTYIPEGGERRITDAIEPTIGSWKRHLKHDANFYVHVADDGSANPRFSENYWRELIGDWAEVGYSRAERQGVGASLNRAHEDCWKRTPITLYAVDDWALETTIFLDPWVKSLLEDESVGCVRLGAAMPFLRGGKMRQMPGGWGIEFERYSYYWCQRPALYHRRFFDAYGPLPEGIDALSVDQQYSEKVNETPGPDAILAILCPWVHIPSVELGTVTPVPGQHPPVKYRKQKYEGLRG